MALSSTPAPSWPNSRREQPWLLPYNRKLRNLISISLRNLSLTATQPSRTASTRFTDDDALPQSLRSPAKLVAQREQKTLGHSRSSNDLRTSAAETAIYEDDTAELSSLANGSPRPSKQKQRPHSAATPEKRPELSRMRRRSTLEWASSSPIKRQQRLEEDLGERLLDVFFSLHMNGFKEPIYTSEVVTNTMNPTFRQIDFTDCGPGVMRSSRIVIRVWTRSGRARRWQQMLCYDLNMGGLLFLGRRLSSVERRLPQNAVLLHLTDGVYAATTYISDLVPHNTSTASRPSTGRTQRELPSSAFDALLRLSRLDDSIQDALQTRGRIARELEELLHKDQTSLHEYDRLVEIRDRIKTIDFAKSTVQKQIDRAQKQLNEKRALLQSRRKLMSNDRKDRAKQAASLDVEGADLADLRNDCEIKQKAIRNQRRRVCEELQSCYVIQPQPSKPLAFTIRELHLPNAEDLDSEPPERIAAALGLGAHMLQLLSFYLDKPLAYPITARGSTSTIFDAISILKTNTPSSSVAASSDKHPRMTVAEIKLRTYPLYSRSVPRFRFEYAIFLLNQNIRLLLENAFGVRVLDIRQTLPNLKYLLYVATAGEGELPARKAGGVRGLLRGARPDLERSGSMDSNSSRLSGLTLSSMGFRNSNGTGNGKAKSATDRLREFDTQR